MPRVLNQVFSFEEMKKRWNGDNPNEPYVRPTVPFWYDLNNWIIRVDDKDKTISTTGWNDNGEYLVVGGTKSISNSPTGHMSDLFPYREKMMPSKPQIATFGPFRGGDGSGWISASEGIGWQITRKDRKLLNSIPATIVKKVKQFAKESNLVWGIKPANGIKKWQMVLKKSFTPLNEMEEWMQVFINSIYEMQRKLDRGTGRNWFDITDIIQKIAYMGEGAEHKDIMKKFGKIVEIIETKYKNGKELKEELNKIIQRRKGELYQ